jgi:hypothetical protein
MNKIKTKLTCVIFSASLLFSANSSAEEFRCPPFYEHYKSPLRVVSFNLSVEKSILCQYSADGRIPDGQIVHKMSDHKNVFPTNNFFWYGSESQNRGCGMGGGVGPEIKDEALSMLCSVTIRNMVGN